MGRKPGPDMVGAGLARNAAEKLKGRKRKIDEEVERMSNPQFEEMKRKTLKLPKPKRK